MDLTKKIPLGLAALACLAFTGCLVEDKEEAGEAAPYLIITTNDKGNGYAATFSAVPSGEVDIASSSSAVQVQTGWGSGAQFEGGDFFIIASYTGVSGIHKYSVDKNGKISDGGVLTGAEHFRVASADKGFYYDPALGKMKVQTFNPKTMERTGEVDLSSLSKGDKFEVAGDQLLVTHQGKLYANVGYSDSLFSSFTLSKYDTGFVAVIDVASGKLDKMIRAPGVPFGFGYPADMDWAFTDADDNFYLISPFNSPWVAPGDRGGQIWRIKSGGTDFDGWKYESKSYGDHRPIMGGHVKDGKIYSAFWSETVDGGWSNFVTDVMQGVTIDLGSKNLTVIDDSPKFRFNANMAMHELDGKVYYSVLNESYNGVYQVEGGKLKPAFTAKSGGSILHFHKFE